MLRRWSKQVDRRLTSSAALHRLTSTSTPIREEVYEALDAAERDQRAKEAAVDSRKVVFASGISADHRPRLAAAEAFDLARSALPSPPNFCCVNITLDYSAMMDAPEVIWSQLAQANGFTPSTIPAGAVGMIGGAVSQQRIGGTGFIQVLLGTIPDLDMDLFTFDAVPTKDMIYPSAASEANPKPRPFAGLACMDAKLVLQHEAVLAHHVQSFASALGPDAPLMGAVFPPVSGAGTADRKASASREDMEESLFFFNDRVYRGSAAGAVLRSNLVKAHQVNVVPSIAVRTDIVVSGVTAPEEPGRPFVIETLGGMPATKFIESVFNDATLGIKETSKIFLGIPQGPCASSGKVQPVVPVTFYANPSQGTCLYALLPPQLSEMAPLANGTIISLLADDVELDSEAGAVELVALQKRLAACGAVSARRDITVAREGRKSIVSSTCCGIHFSHRLMNISAQRNDMVSLGLGGSASVLNAPSVLQRVLGQSISNCGVYTPGQIVTVGDVTMISARSSSYTVFEGLQ